MESDCTAGLALQECTATALMEHCLERDLRSSRRSQPREGCSPVLHHGRIIIVRDHAGQSSIEVLEAATGQTVWKRTRDEKNAWATPKIFTKDGERTQVVTAAKFHSQL